MRTLLLYLMISFLLVYTVIGQTPEPTQSPTETLTDTPTPIPTMEPSISPTDTPTPIPTTTEPSISPTRNPTRIPTLNPSARPTITTTLSPTVIPIQFSKSTLVLGIGQGTLTIIVLAVTLAFVFCLSEGCERKEKSSSRVISTAIFAVIFLALVLAPRENQIKDQTPSTTGSNSDLYDSSIVPRIAISIVTMFFTAIATCSLCVDLRVHHTLSTMTYEERAFWQD